MRSSRSGDTIIFNRFNRRGITKLRDASRKTSSEILLWTRRGSPLRALLVISIGTIVLLTTMALVVFTLFFVAATISLLISLAVAGGFLALFFLCLTGIYIGALSVAAFVISTAAFCRLLQYESLRDFNESNMAVNRALLRARAQSPADVANHPLIKEPYDITRDRERKRALSMVLSQSRHQEKKDAEILAEAKRITEMRLAARRAEEPDVSANENIGLDRADGRSVSPSSNSQLPSTAVAPSTLTMADYASTLASLRMLHVYLRTYGLEQMVQAASSAVGLRTIKRVEQTLQDLGVNLKPKVPTKTVCDEHLELRKEILTLLNLQKQLQYKETEGSSHREGSYAAMPDTPKDRVFASDQLSFGAERPSKKEQKRKGPGRQADTPSPAHKRPRKMKASDL